MRKNVNDEQISSRGGRGFSTPVPISSLKSVVRSGGRTVLFFLLIGAVTLVTVLGVNLWDSVQKYLDECERTYLTVGSFEYMSPEYPDERVFDPGIREFLDGFDFSLITENENVLQWDRSERALGYIEGFRRFDSAVPFKNAGVLIVGSAADTMWNGTKLHVLDALYSYNDMDGRAVSVDTVEEWLEDVNKYNFRPGRTYVVHGEFEYGGGGVPRFWLKEFDGKFARDLGVLDGVKTWALDVTGEVQGPEYEFDEENVFAKIARVYEVVNNSVDVYATGNLEAMYPFHQQLLYLVEGRGFSAEEYAAGERVCVVTKLIAEKCGVGIGDEISLSIAVAEDVPAFESFWPDEGFQYEERYKVVGVTNNVDGMSHYVYVPKSSDLVLDVNQIGYTIGQAVLKNGRADEFLRGIEPMLSERVRLTIYDQGYETVRKPFEDILLVVKIVTAVSVLLGVAVLAMFGFIYVYRQREVSVTMISLGTGRFRVLVYFGFGAFLVSFGAAALGAAGAFFFSDLVVKLVNWISTGYLAPYDFYSNSKLTAVRALEFAPVADVRLFVLLGAVVVGLAVLSALVFALVTFRAVEGRRSARGSRERQGGLGSRDGRSERDGRRSVKVRDGRSSKMRGGPLKYSILSIRRGGVRSLVVPATAVVIVVFLSQLAGTSGRYELKLQDIYESSVIRGQFTDPVGRPSGNLLIEAYLMNELLDSGYIGELDLLKNFSYEYMGRSVADGVAVELDPFYIPENPFTAERLYNKILLGDKLVCTNSIKSTTEFLFADTIVMEFLDGYDEGFLAEAVDFDGGELPGCMISTDMMAEEGILLGDTIRVAVATDEMRRYGETDLVVVGTFEKQGLKDAIYAPLGAYIDAELLAGEPSEVREQLFGFKFQSAVFTVADAGRLEEFREYLFDAGYSEVRGIGPVRFFVVLEDRIFNNTVNTLKQQIRYINVLYPFLYLMVMVIGVVVSYLLVVIRRSEIAIMRGLGARRGRVFLTFFFEQAVLCVVGCVIGLAGWAAVMGVQTGMLVGSVSVLQLWLVGGFVLFFFIGSAVAVSKVGRKAGE